MTASRGKEMCNTTYKTTVFCKREVKQSVISSVGFGEMYQQEITMKYKDSDKVSILRQRWVGYRTSECNSPSVFLRYDEVIYPVSRRSSHEKVPRCMIKSSVHNNNEEPKKKWCNWWILLLLCLILSAVVISSYLLLQNPCNKVFNTEKFRHILDENFFGQDKVKDQLIRIIESLNSPVNSDLQFLVFSGSSGVGKTYVASLIAQFFPWSENVQHFMAPLHSELSVSDIHKHLSPCGYNLVIIDDLKETDVNFIWELKRNYELINRKFLKVIFICIFNYEIHFSVSDNDNLFNTQQESSNLVFNRSVTHFQFKRLEENDILKFVNNSLYRRGITEPQVVINAFMSSFLSPSFLDGGCKRVSSKLALFLEMYEQKDLRANL